MVPQWLIDCSDIFWCRTFPRPAIDGTNSTDHAPHRRSRHRSVQQIMIITNTFCFVYWKKLMLLEIDVLLSLFVNDIHMGDTPSVKIAKTEILCSANFFIFFAKRLVFHSTQWPQIAWNCPLFARIGCFVICFRCSHGQACCVTCCGRTQTRRCRDGGKTTEACPSPSEPMWSASFSTAMTLTLYAVPIR